MVVRKLQQSCENGLNAEFIESSQACLRKRRGHMQQRTAGENKSRGQQKRNGSSSRKRSSRMVNETESSRQNRSRTGTVQAERVPESEMRQSYAE